MRLSYTYLEEAFASNELDESDELTRGAIKVLAQGLGVAEKSIHYLLQNGWAQSIQDAFAGPRAKALKDGLGADSNAVKDIILAAASKRRQAIIDGVLSPNSGHGRDPIKSVGMELLTLDAKKRGKKLPQDKEKLDRIWSLWLEANRARVQEEIANRRKSKSSLIEADAEDFI